MAELKSDDLPDIITRVDMKDNKLAVLASGIGDVQLYKLEF